MKSNLIALAVAALVGGMLVVPLTHQSAMAQVHAGIKGLGSTGGTPTTGTAPMTGTANERGDVILAINDEPIRTAQQARLLVAAFEPGDQINLDGFFGAQPDIVPET